MTDWSVGDLAVCLKNRWVGTRYGGSPTTHPEKGKIYRVTSVKIEGCTLRLRFEEFGLHAWNAIGFRKIRPDAHEACENEFITLLKRRKSPAQHEHIMDGLGDD